MVSFTQNNLGTDFRIKLTSCAGTLIDPDTIRESFIVFYLPNGTRLQEAAIIEEYPEGSGEHYIVYKNESPESSILTLRGSWEYTAKIITQDNEEYESSERVLFWVTKGSNYPKSQVD